MNESLLPPLFEKDRPDWELRFTDVSTSVLSVMPGESDKTFYDPLIQREVKWEQDVFCPTFVVFDGRLYCVYRSWGEDGQWRMGLGWSEDGLRFARSDKPVFYAKPEDEFLGSLREIRGTSVTYGDPRIFAVEDGAVYLLFNYLRHGTEDIAQQLGVASTRNMADWTVHGRIFAKQAAQDSDVIPEKAPWRFPHPAIVTRFDGTRFVAAKIRGRYWMYLNCLTRQENQCCLCMATSWNMLDWEVLRDGQGRLVHPMPLRPGRFDSLYVDTTAAVLRNDGILLIYNGINAEPESGGDPRLQHRAHYPAQALFDRDDPSRLLRRSESPFMGGNRKLEERPIVYWYAPVYESWSLVPFRKELLLYWNHTFGRRAVALSKGPIPESLGRVSGSRLAVEPRLAAAS